MKRKEFEEWKWGFTVALEEKVHRCKQNAYAWRRAHSPGRASLAELEALVYQQIIAAVNHDAEDLE